MMPMGDLNSASTFVSMMMELQIEWYTLDKERVLKNTASKIIADDVLMYGRTAEHLLDYFRTFLDVLKHYRATLKPKMCNFFKTGAIL